MPTRTYHLIDHTADFGIRVFGKTRAALYENAGLAMFDLLADPVRVSGNSRETLRVTGMDPIDLLINWLRELLYLWNGRAKLVKQIQVTEIDDTGLAADLRLDTYDPATHVLRNEIKAVTYHQLTVERSSANEWVATVIFDA